MLITGNLLNTTTGTINDHIYSKAGAGALAIQGTASTEVGAFNITNGSVFVNALGALNSNTAGGGVQIGSGGTWALLNYLGGAGTGVAETSNKAIILSGTTDNAVILANQQQSAANTGATGLVLTSSIAANGAGAKGLYLGGYNNTVNSAVVNQIQGLIQDESTLNVTSLIKGGSGSWLYSPAASTFVSPTLAAATTNTINGAVATAATTITLTSVTGLSVGMVVSGSGSIPNGDFITAINGNVITLNSATTATIATAATLAFNGLASSGTVTSATGLANTNVIPMTSVTGLVVGQSVTGPNIPSGSVITAINGSTITINNNIATAIASGAALTFGSTTTGTSNGFSGNVTISGGTLQVQPTASSGLGSAPLNATAGATTNNNVIFTTDAVTGTGFAGGTFQLLGTANGITGALTTNVGQLQLTAGAGTIITTATSGGGTPTLSFVNTTALTRTAGAVVDFAPGPARPFSSLRRPR